MRTTMQTIHQNILSNLNKVTEEMYRINNQISSGRQMSKLADDPVNLVTALGLRSNVKEIQQYQENLVYGDNTIAAAESSLTQVKELLSRAKVLSLQQVNASLTAENRANAAEEVRHLYEQAIILANTQLNGKYIFGGQRTTGYSEAEPAPFIADKMDGHRANANPIATTDGMLTSTVTNTAIAADELAINGNNIGAIATAAAVNGLNMTKAFNAKTAIEAADPAVSANLTTLYAGAAATGDTADAADSTISFRLNTTLIEVTIPDGTGANGVATLVAQEIEKYKAQTGVTATVGDGATNGGPADSVVLTNTRSGDESPIRISDLTEPGTAASGLANGSYTPDATHNTGEISLSSDSSFTLTSLNVSDDSILTELGLAGGGIGFADEADDGELIYGSRLAATDLEVNGYAVGATSDDGISTIYADASAAAKATAINAISDQTGVTASVVPVSHEGFAPIDAVSVGALLTGTVDNTAIGAGELEINSTPIGAIAAGAMTSGLAMDKAFNAATAINAQSGATTVSAYLTTLYAGAAVTADTVDGSDSTIAFDLNGVSVSVTIPDGTEAADVASLVVSAINDVGEETGVKAAVGTNNNGGVLNSIVLRNARPGDETAIDIAALNEPGTAASGLAIGTYNADATHNTGEISLASPSSFTLASPFTPPTPNPKDSILDALGLGGGDIGVDDIADDGTLDFDGTTAATLGPGDLVINGVDIFDTTTRIVDLDGDNALIKAINAKTADTGIKATRNSIGKLILSAEDGRNLHIQTSPRGEAVTQLTNGQHDQVYFGALQLYSGTEFMLETTPTATSAYEPGLDALALAGGSAVTGETGDTAGDGILWVRSIAEQDDAIRYAGDRENDVQINVSRGSKLDITKNGYDALSDTGVFSSLKDFESYLRGDNFTAATAVNAVTNTSVVLNHANSGLEDGTDISDGTITLTITDHEYAPPQESTISIPVDADVDTFEVLAQKLDGIPGLSAAWDADGYLELTTTDPDRYTFAIDEDTSGLLETVGINTERMQIQALETSIAALDSSMDSITSQISDFGARANRITVQNQILTNLELSTTENLSDKEDTDIVEAIMELKGKEFAYQSALAAAARTMQLSLVNYL